MLCCLQILNFHNCDWKNVTQTHFNCRKNFNLCSAESMTVNQWERITGKITIKITPKKKYFSLYHWHPEPNDFLIGSMFQGNSIKSYRVFCLFVFLTVIWNSLNFSLSNIFHIILLFIIISFTLPGIKCKINNSY